jgi:putative ubiquitin-RnfH superfamily antitoxin RatB of RatAB toxin-antitoxin module
MSTSFQIEVAYATPELQKIVVVSVEENTSVFDGARTSGIEKFFPEIDYDAVNMGVFGKVVRKPKEQLLKEGDRIEIYRPLLIDPKQARLNRAAKKD